jgi:polar amino acid transport system substrate-binding protein
MAAALAGALVAGLATPGIAQNKPPLRSGIDGTFAPHAFPRLGGGLEGFNIDLAAELSKRMGREILIDNATFSGLIPALNAGRYDLLMALVTLTRERAENMLFTEPYITVGFQVALKRGTPPISSMDALKGKAISVNKGSLYDTYATRRAEEMGWEVQRYETQTDALQAVIAGRAFANIGGNTAIKFAAARNPQIQASIPVPGTRNTAAIPFRLGDTENRNAVERALECMKKDGAMAALSRKWFGVDPAPDSAEMTIYPGFGAPGFPGHDPTPHEPQC